MYNTSPAFSIARKYQQIDRQTKPTPLTYNLENWNPQKTPSWKIGNDKKCKHFIDKNPGPGHYNISLAQRLNKFGIIGKQNGRVKLNHQKSPSPDSYSPKFIEHGPAISFAKKIPIYTDDSSKPGPGEYEKNDLFNTVGSVIGKSKRFFEDKEPKLIPGPGSYEYRRPSSAKVSFGKEKRQCGHTINIVQDPGPGQYQHKSIFDSSIKSSKGFSLGMKTSIKEHELNPGPCNYDPDYKKFSVSNPCFTISMKYKPIYFDNTPAPNAYDVKVPCATASLLFQKAKRQQSFHKKDTPGPGKYQPQNQFKSSPKFSLGISRKSDLVEDFPGPGAYEPNKNLIKARPQSAKIGKSLRCCQKRDTVPGPGEYETIKKSNSITPSHTFGKDSRMKQTATATPGPGQYIIPSSVAYVASYVFK